MSTNTTYAVTVAPDEAEIQCRSGDNLLDVLHRADVDIASYCGGAGTCGGCRVIVEGGEARTARGATVQEGDECLACRAEIVGDLQVRIPAESRRADGEVATDEPRHVLGAVRPDREIEVDPLCQVTPVQMTPPSLADNTSDFDRTCRALQEATGREVFTASHGALRRMAAQLRDSDWEPIVLWLDLQTHGEIIDLLSPGAAGGAYGLAIDIGTTTVVADLVDLRSGASLGRAGEYNAQQRCGEDVISRINFASQRDDGIETLREAVTGTINQLVAQLTDGAAVSAREIRVAVCAGNTTMIHTLYGLDPNNIRRQPYIPTIGNVPPLRASELGLDVDPDARIFSFPAVGSFVGGDVVAGALDSRLTEREDMTLFVDIGTNGEIVLAAAGSLLACSASAGPAFEGGGISCGTRAVPGAVERFRVSPGGDEVSYRTIGGEAPVGVCGTGLIDLMHALLRAGVINRSGRFNTELETERLRATEEGYRYLLVPAEETRDGRDLTIETPDIRTLLRSKAAIYAGIRMLLTNLALDESAVGQVLIAGGFGTHINLEAAVAIGLFPDIERDRFQFVGNSALRGAREALLSRLCMREARELAGGMTYLELSADEQAAAFMDEFVAAEFLPHTEMERFPSVADDGAPGP